MTTITISDRSPVEIVSADWPIIAHVKNLLRFGANVTYITVREHVTDGRRLVFGRSVFGVEDDAKKERRGGFLVEAGGDTVRAIRRVAGIIDDNELGDECIACLPPVVLK